MCICICHILMLCNVPFHNWTWRCGSGRRCLGGKRYEHWRQTCTQAHASTHKHDHIYTHTHTNACMPQEGRWGTYTSAHFSLPNILAQPATGKNTAKQTLKQIFARQKNENNELFLSLPHRTSPIRAPSSSAASETIYRLEYIYVKKGEIRQFDGERAFLTQHFVFK